MLFGEMFKGPSFDAVMVTFIIIILAMERGWKIFKTTDKEGEIREAARQKAKRTLLGIIFGRKK